MNTFWLTIYFRFTRRLIVPVFVLYLVDLQFTPSQIAVVVGSSFFTTLILEFPSGAIADTIGHRKTLVFSAWLLALSGLCLTWSTFPGIIIATVLFGAAVSFLSGTFSAYVYEFLKMSHSEDQYSKTMGRMNGISNAVSVIEISLFAWLYTFSPLIPILLSALLPAIASLIMLRMKEAPKVESVEKKEGYAELLHHTKQAISIFRTTPLLLRLSLLSSLIVSFTLAGADMQQALMRDAGLTVTAIGLIYSIKRVGSTSVSFLGGYFSRLGARTYFFLQMLILLTFLWGMSLGTGKVLFVIAATASSVTFALYRVVSMQFINELVPSGSRATTISLGTFLVSILVILHLSIFAVVSERFGYQAGFLYYAVMASIVLPLAYTSYYRASRS